MASNNSASSTKKAPRAAAAAALSAMLAFNVCPAEAFTPSFLVPSSTMTHRSPSFSISALTPAAVTMDCSPWDMECYGARPFGGPGGLQRRRRMQQRRPGPMIFAPEDLFQGPAVQSRQQFTVGDPTVTQDTDDLYMLTFDLPADVDHDGLEVSVSERLLTVKIRMTREEDADPSARWGGWVTRSSRTDSASRSFVLPEGLSSSSAAASLLSDGKAEVKFAKNQAASDAAATGTAPPNADSAVPVKKAGPTPSSSAETGSPPSSAATAAGEPATAGGDATAAADTPPAASSTADAPSPAAERPAALPESPFDVLDQEFREFAKAMWGEEVVERLQVPTQEEMAEKAAAAKEAWAKREAKFAERVEAAKEARTKREAEFAARVEAAKEDRAKRVVAMRRATMASDVSRSEDGSSYVVRVALPEGVTRHDVKLAANPNGSLRVTVSANNAQESGRSIYKDVVLPSDALIEDISAKFEAEKQDESDSNNKDGVEGEVVAKNAADAGTVSGLEVTVGRAGPPQPKIIDIL